MTGKRWLPSILATGICLSALALAPRAEAAAVLTPLSPTVVGGNTVTLTLSDSFDPSLAVGAIDLQVSFNPALLSFVSVTDGSLLTAANWDPASGNVDPTNPSSVLIGISEDLGNDLSGAGNVIMLTFSALAADPTTQSSVSIRTIDSAVGVQGEYQLASISKSINITAAPTTPPTTVPEPGTVALLLVPMLAVARIKLRDRC